MKKLSFFHTSPFLLLQASKFYHGFPEHFLMLRLHLRQRKSRAAHCIALHTQRGLYGNGIDLAEQRVHKVQRLELQFACLVIAVCQAVRYHVVSLLRSYVGEHGDHADASEGADRDDLVVVSRIDVNDAVSERGKLCNLTDVARRLFIATMLSTSFASLTAVSGRILDPVLDGTL